jgi:hypothetical protein
MKHFMTFNYDQNSNTASTRFNFSSNYVTYKKYINIYTHIHTHTQTHTHTYLPPLFYSYVFINYHKLRKMSFIPISSKISKFLDKFLHCGMPCKERERMVNYFECCCVPGTPCHISLATKSQMHCCCIVYSRMITLMLKNIKKLEISQYF